MSATAALIPTSEPTRIQRRRTSSALRRSDGERATILELDHRSDETPADREPDRDGDEEHGARQHDPDHDEECDRSEKRPDAAEREPIGGPGGHRTIGVDLDERARRCGHDETESQQRERRADDHGEERPRTRCFTRHAPDEVERAEQQPLHEGDGDRNGNEEHAQPEEEARSS